MKNLRPKGYYINVHKIIKLTVNLRLMLCNVWTEVFSQLINWETKVIVLYSNHELHSFGDIFDPQIQTKYICI